MNLKLQTVEFIFTDKEGNDYIVEWNSRGQATINNRVFEATWLVMVKKDPRIGKLEYIGRWTSANLVNKTNSLRFLKQSLNQKS